MNGDDYAKSFHNYSVIWNQTGIYFSIDGVSIGGVTPPAGGFYKLSGSKGTNFWSNGTQMAPYDKRVSNSLTLVPAFKLFNFLYSICSFSSF